MMRLAVGIVIGLSLSLPAQAQTRNDPGARYNAALERCAMNYRHAMERASLGSNPNSRERAVASANRSRELCEMVARQSYERVMMRERRQ